MLRRSDPWTPPELGRRRGRVVRDFPWRGLAGLGTILAVCILAATLPPAVGLVCVMAAALLAIRLLSRLGTERGLRDHRQ